MPTQQIAHDQWEKYLSKFSACNQTRSVNLDMESNELGPQRLINNRPLIAIEPDVRCGEECTIVVVAGDTEGGQPEALTHEIKRPQAMWVKQDDAGCIQAIDFETDDGRTILEFV
jgi:hypothetical protein